MPTSQKTHQHQPQNRQHPHHQAIQMPTDIITEHQQAKDIIWTLIAVEKTATEQQTSAVFCHVPNAHNVSLPRIYKSFL